VSERLERGPASTTELDTLKTSIQAERRTDDQKVSIIKFIASEKSVTTNAYNLTVALENTKNASATAKKAAALAVIGGHTLAYEVASVFVPLIAEKKYVSWNGFTYINLIEDKTTADLSADDANRKERMRNMVTYALPSSMGRSAADLFGSRKMGQVFWALFSTEEHISEIKSFILFCLLLRSKPSGWISKAQTHVTKIGRQSLYLRHMLSMCIWQYREEISTENERQSLKELIASVRLLREANVKKPSPTAVKEVISKLDLAGYWEKTRGDDSPA
jgi:hypothetical protein